MATSLVLLMRESGGFASADEAKVLDAFSGKYLSTLLECVDNDREKTAQRTADNAYGKLDEFLQRVANKRSRQRLLDTYAPLDAQGARRLSPQASPDLAAVPASIAEALRAALPAYGGTLAGGVSYSASHFAVKSVALRLHAGLGSLGSTRYYVQIEGETASPEDDVILDVKAQGAPSAYLSLAPESIAATEAAAGQDPARRVVLAARVLGSVIDPYLGTLRLSGGSYSVRERSPWKDYLDSEKLSTVERLSKLSEQWAAILAFAHARADRDSKDSRIPYDFETEVSKRTRGKQAEFSALVLRVAKETATQATDDHRAFVQRRAAGH
jgi:uncharacterized protein (DUF2252 family)